MSGYGLHYRVHNQPAGFLRVTLNELHWRFFSILYSLFIYYLSFILVDKETSLNFVTVSTGRLHQITMQRFYFLYFPQSVTKVKSLYFQILFLRILIRNIYSQSYNIIGISKIKFNLFYNKCLFVAYFGLIPLLFQNLHISNKNGSKADSLKIP